MDKVSFKERVKNEAIANATIYEQNFVNYEYLGKWLSFAYNKSIIK